MKSIFLIALLSMLPLITYGQKLKSDGISVEILSYELTEQEFPVFGKQTMILGTFVIKKGRKI